ncbi:MAG: DUF4349 domain-containing protein [Parvularculaceae bacterium]|nr:DUF4349 domain-containing protein [Parvularculaceae bacterium]
MNSAWKRAICLVLVAALSAGGCSQDAAAPAASKSVSRGGYAEADMAVAESAPAPPPGGGEAPAQAGVMLAYSYSMGIEAPKAAIAPMVAAHEKKCIEAGASVCQVLGSSVQTYGEDQEVVSGYLNLRAEPKWLATFRAEIASDASNAGGVLTANTVSTEDLTQYIVDTEARLAAKRALRERIRQLLETREGSLNDVLAAERALAEVQGEIDSMTAQLEAAKARVAMSALQVSYQSDPETATSMFKPLADAFSDFGRNSMTALAGVVTLVSTTWPFFILGLVVLWIVFAWLRGLRRRKAKA